METATNGGSMAKRAPKRTYVTQASYHPQWSSLLGPRAALGLDRSGLVPQMPAEILGL